MTKYLVTRKFYVVVEAESPDIAHAHVEDMVMVEPDGVKQFAKCFTDGGCTEPEEVEDGTVVEINLMGETS